MTINADALRPFLKGFVYPVPIYREKGDEIDDFATEQRLRQYIRDGLVIGQKRGKLIRRIRFTMSLRRAMSKQRMVKPADAIHLPIAGDIVLAYKDTRFKYRHARKVQLGLAVQVKTVWVSGRTMDETVTPVDL